MADEKKEDAAAPAQDSAASDSKQDESASEDQGAAKVSKGGKKSSKPAAPAQDSAPAKVKVKPLVNMLCLDGTRMIAGEATELSEIEYQRLLKDARGPFFEA